MLICLWYPQLWLNHYNTQINGAGILIQFQKMSNDFINKEIVILE